MQAIQERHENSLLKSEIDKLRDENKALRESIKKQSCPNCGFGSPNREAVSGTDDQKLRIENARLKAEVQEQMIILCIFKNVSFIKTLVQTCMYVLNLQVEKLKSVIGKYPHGTSPRSSSYPSSNNQESRSSFEFYTGNSGLEKTRIMDAVNRAVDEVRKMAIHGEPLWIRSYETGREILNYDEYRKEFCAENYNSLQPRQSVEASRESALIFVDLPWLVQTFMDAVNISQFLRLNFIEQDMNS